jgi:hypothetical protein
MGMTERSLIHNNALLIGQMVTHQTPQHTLSGECPDGHACTLPTWCSRQCSRLESVEIRAELLANARLAAGGLSA